MNKFFLMILFFVNFFVQPAYTMENNNDNGIQNQENVLNAKKIIALISLALVVPVLRNIFHKAAMESDVSGNCAVIADSAFDTSFIYGILLSISIAFLTR